MSEPRDGAAAGGTRILAIDPGPVQSAYVYYQGGCFSGGILLNEELRRQLPEQRRKFGEGVRLAVEMIASYGMPVGQDVFRTCLWIGRFVEAWGGPYTLVTRLECKLHICHHGNAKDPHVRQALIDRFGPPGTKKQPGKTYGFKADMWAALACAVTCAEGGARGMD